MASLSRSPYGVYALTCRYAGQRLHRSLNTRSEAAAHRLKGVIETALDQLQKGQLNVPEKLTTSQLWRILQSGSKSMTRPAVTGDVTLEKVCQQYVESYTRGTKDETTLRTEKHHLNHFKRLLGQGFR